MAFWREDVAVHGGTTMVGLLRFVLLWSHELCASYVTRHAI